MLRKCLLYVHLFEQLVLEDERAHAISILLVHLLAPLQLHQRVADVVVARLNLQGALQVHFAQLQIRPCGVGVRAPVEPAHVGVVQLQRSSTHLHRLLVLAKLDLARSGVQQRVQLQRARRVHILALEHVLKLHILQRAQVLFVGALELLLLKQIVAVLLVLLCRAQTVVKLQLPALPFEKLAGVLLSWQRAPVHEGAAVGRLCDLRRGGDVAQGARARRAAACFPQIRPLRTPPPSAPASASDVANAHLVVRAVGAAPAVALSVLACRVAPLDGRIFLLAAHTRPLAAVLPAVAFCVHVARYVRAAANVGAVVVELRLGPLASGSSRLHHTAASRRLLAHHALRVKLFTLVCLLKTRLRAVIILSRRPAARHRL
mmetsp:Transcript_11984/g.22725  ORF Transcript_11984/g.22725 Transcript_11984/m.22725 type:complete len:375 (-) Transcript_11984:519-1643(-)